MDDKTIRYIEEQKNLDDLYADAFKGTNKKVLDDLYEFCGKESICYEKDARQTAYMLGARSVALYIQDRISHEFSKRNEDIKRKETNYV